MSYHNQNKHNLEAPDSFLKKFFKPVLDLIAKAQGVKLRESLEDVIENDDQGQNAFSPEEKSMIRNILEFSDVDVEDIMVPRADLIAADINTPVAEVLMLFSDAGFSRCPIYDGNLDRPVGMVHFKDIMTWLVRHSSQDKMLDLDQLSFDQPIGELNIIREVLYVPHSMLASDLLLNMQKQRIHMALVIDEYGGTDGLLTIEDLVEEIVGEIEDEHDDDADLPTIEEIDEHNFNADARLPMEELERQLKVDFLSDDRDEDVETLGGLVFSLAGRIPTRGELIEHSSGTIFEILEADSRRIKRLKITLKSDHKKAKS
ncbi:MAG: HlyC/CorC family transporter [OCS116 cluster bacterium]|nr:HlyC/CorC family transporter [OCS116 cluster bacterium]